MSSVSPVFSKCPIDLSSHPKSISRAVLSSSIPNLPAPAALASPSDLQEAIILPVDPLSIEGMMEDFEMIESVAKKALKQEGLEEWEEIAPSQEVEIEKLLRGETAIFQEKGRFTRGEFYTMMDRNEGKAIMAFSSYIPGQPAYPYEVPDVETKEGESVTDAIVKHFAKQAIGSSNPKVVQMALDGKSLSLDNKILETQKKARHICAFLKLLGDNNNPVNAHIVNGILDQNSKVVLGVVALKPGRLITDCDSAIIGYTPIMYRVVGDEVGLYKIEALDQPIARYTTSRTVTVSPPDRHGEVEYAIVRTFTKI